MINQHLHILLIEDDIVDVESVKRAFAKSKIANPLHIAKDGLEALDLLQGQHGKQQLTPMPRIVLLDLNMPRMNGLEFLQHIRDDVVLKSLLVFVMTTSKEEQDIVSAYNFNIAGYIIKPVDFDSFTEALHRLQLYWTLLEFPHEKNQL